MGQETLDVLSVDAAGLVQMRWREIVTRILSPLCKSNTQGSLASMRVLTWEVRKKGSSSHQLLTDCAQPLQSYHVVASHSVFLTSFMLAALPNLLNAFLPLFCSALLASFY